MGEIQKAAMAFPGTEEGASCNKAAFKAGKKSFLFMGMDDENYNLMLKLGDRLEEAESLSNSESYHYSVGKHGWISMNFTHDEKAPMTVLNPWIEESFRLLVPKKLVAELEELV